MGFKKIPGFRGLVSEEGVVINERGRPFKTLIISNSVYVKICAEGSSTNKPLMIAKAVLRTFKPGERETKYVRFIDGDKSNCSLHNLAWYTEELSRHSLTMYSKEQVIELLNSSNSITDIEEYMGYSQITVRNILNKLNLGRVEDRLKYAHFHREFKNKPKERWKKIDDTYIISNTGRIINTVTDKELKVADSGYIISSVFGASPLAQMVAEKFLKNPKGYPTLLNLDGDRKNCSVENLVWCSMKMKTKVLPKGIEIN